VYIHYFHSYYRRRDKLRRSASIIRLPSKPGDDHTADIHRAVIVYWHRSNMLIRPRPSGRATD